MGLERLVVPIEWKASSDDQTLVGYASTFGNVDLGGDVVVKGAFTKTIANIKANGIPLLADHVAMTSSVLGTIYDAKETDKGLWIKARFSSAPSAQDVRIKMLEGHVNKLSIGYESIKDRMVDREGKRVRELVELKLWETSGVVFPMNPEAAISRVKSVVSELADADRKRLVQDLTEAEGHESKATANELREGLQKALREYHKDVGEYAYLRDYDATKVWYELYSSGSTSIHQRDYEVDDKASILLGEKSVEVRAVTNYVPVDDAKAATVLVHEPPVAVHAKSSPGDEPGASAGKAEEKAADPAATQSDEPGDVPDEGAKGAYNRWSSEAVLAGRDPEALADGAKRAGLATTLELLEADPDLQSVTTPKE